MAVTLPDARSPPAGIMAVRFVTSLARIDQPDRAARPALGHRHARHPLLLRPFRASTLSARSSCRSTRWNRWPAGSRPGILTRGSTMCIMANWAACAIPSTTWRAELAKTDQLKNDFISSVSHELRTPLDLDQGMGRDACRGRTRCRRKPAGPAGLGIIMERDRPALHDGGGAARLLPDAERRPLAAPSSGLDLGAELGDVLLMMGQRAESEGIRFSCYQEPDDPLPGLVSGHRNRLRQVFVNLLDNALKYSPPRRRRSGWQLLPAEENWAVAQHPGRGARHFDREDLAAYQGQILQGPVARSAAAASGLAVVDEIVAAHSGTFDIESEPARVRQCASGCR